MDRKVIRIISIIALIFINSNAFYGRLTKDQIKSFGINYQDLITAYTSKNYRGFKVHSALFLDTYKNVLIDPLATELRDNYFKIEELSNNLADIVKFEQLTKEIDLIKLRAPEIGDIALMERYLDFLYENKIGESILSEEVQYFHNLIENIYRIDSSPETYRIIAASKYTPDEFLTSCARTTEKAMEQELLQLITELNIEKVVEFERNNKGLFVLELASIKEKCKAHDKAALVKDAIPKKEVLLTYSKRYGGFDKPLEKKIKSNFSRYIQSSKNIDAYADYLEIFPETKPEEPIAQFVATLLMRQALSGDPMSGIMYLNFFPYGKYANELKDYIQANNSYMSSNQPMMSNYEQVMSNE